MAIVGRLEAGVGTFEMQVGAAQMILLRGGLRELPKSRDRGKAQCGVNA